MKVIILAGGYGTRLAEFTEKIPKPMVTIGGKPILFHIMERYAHFGHKDFYIALGYKSSTIKDYFLKYHTLNSDFTANLSSGKIEYHNSSKLDWNVTLVDTGLDTMTGGRLKRLRSYIGNETCLMTYGDGVANVDIEKLLDFHKNHGKLATLTAVRPTAKFGELSFDEQKVTSFKEKPQIQEGRINGGFFVFEPDFFEYIKDDSMMLEREPINKAVKDGQLMAYFHDDFWQCMDTKRDKDLLERLWISGSAPWSLF